MIECLELVTCRILKLVSVWASTGSDPCSFEMEARFGFVDFLIVLCVVNCGLPLFDRSRGVGELTRETLDGEREPPGLGDLVTERSRGVGVDSVRVEKVSYQAHFRRQNGKNY